MVFRPRFFLCYLISEEQKLSVKECIDNLTAVDYNCAADAGIGRSACSLNYTAVNGNGIAITFLKLKFFINFTSNSTFYFT